MLRTGLSSRRPIVGIAAILTCLLAVVAAALDRPAALHSPTRQLPALPTMPISPRPKPQPMPSNPRPVHPAATHPTLIGRILLIVLAVLVVLAVLGLAHLIWRARRDRERATQEEGAFPEMGEVQESVEEAVAESLADLRIGRPDEAIVRCWIRLERAITEVGVPIRRYETSSELVIRVFDELDVPRGPLVDLESLYREARYSAHQMPESARARARADLERIGPSLLPSGPPAEPAAT